MNSMSDNTKVIRKWFLPSDFDKVENYLCDMSRQGWHLKEAKNGFGTNKYHFEKGESKNYSYAIQYIIKDQNTGSYCKSIKNAGWNNITILPYLWNGEWHYYRKEYKDGKREQLLTDNESKLDLLKNILRSLWIIGLCLIFSGVSAMSNSFQTILGDPNARLSMPFAISILTIYCAALVIYAMVLIPLIGKISKMNKDFQE